MKKIGPSFIEEARAAGIEIASYVIGGRDTDIWAPNADPEALKALIAAHDPDKPVLKYKQVKAILDVLTDAETDMLQNRLKPKQLWALLAKGEEIIKQDDNRILALCTILGITPAELFNR